MKSLHYLELTPRGFIRDKTCTKHPWWIVREMARPAIVPCKNYLGVRVIIDQDSITEPVNPFGTYVMNTFTEWGALYNIRGKIILVGFGESNDDWYSVPYYVYNFINKAF